MTRSYTIRIELNANHDVNEVQRAVSVLEEYLQGQSFVSKLAGGYFDSETISAAEPTDENSYPETVEDVIVISSGSKIKNGNSKYFVPLVARRSLCAKTQGQLRIAKSSHPQRRRWTEQRPSPLRESTTNDELKDDSTAEIIIEDDDDCRTDSAQTKLIENLLLDNNETSGFCEHSAQRQSLLMMSSRSIESLAEDESLSSNLLTFTFVSENNATELPAEIPTVDCNINNIMQIHTEIRRGDEETFGIFNLGPLNTLMR